MTAVGAHQAQMKRSMPRRGLRKRVERACAMLSKAQSVTL